MKANVPGIGDQLLEYLIEVACADKIIADEELSLLYDFGQKLGFTPVAISHAIATEIRKNYVPKVM